MIHPEDRYYIERKYHDPEKPFDPFKRRAYHGIGYLPDSGLREEQLLQGLAELEPSLASLPHSVAKAKAVAYVLENQQLYINPHDYFVGLESLNRLADSVTFSKWEKESLKLRDPALVEKAKDLNSAGAVMIWTDYDHVVPDWRSLMELGFPGILDRARQYYTKHREAGTLDAQKEAFFQAIEIQYTAILQLLDRMSRKARSLEFDKAEQIAVCLDHLRDGRPTDFYEALQLMYLYFIISECIDSYQVRSLGNGLDATLYPFYQQDLESGRYTEEQLQEFLEGFFLQWSAIGNYWGQPFYLGGTDLQGNTKYNRLSHMILEVYDRLEIYNPKIQLKINENTPDSILQKAFTMVRRKNASIVFCCEPGLIRAVMGYGVTYEEALEMDLRGCYETGVRANEVCSTSGYVNAAKAVEYVFSDGFDARIQKQVGMKTGSLESLDTFDKFYQAFLQQWAYLIGQSIQITNDAERFLSFVNPGTMYSATVQTSLEKGVDGYAGGVKYNNNNMPNCGFASAVDSLMAVKEFVYETRQISLQELAKALEDNWEGYQLLRAKIKKSPCKYGNNHPCADAYAQDMADWFAGKVNLVPNSKGGVYKAILHCARAFITQGERTGALPDGRLAGEELSKNASPVAGMEKQGVTGVIQSAVKLGAWKYPEAFCLDVMLHPSAMEGENGYTAFKGLLMTYLKAGGQSIHFNVFDAGLLRSAQQHPEKYQNLQVRVCGWNALWNNLSKKEQDAYILRAEGLH